MSILQPDVVWINGSCFRKNVLEQPELYSVAGAGGDAIDEYADDAGCYGDHAEYQESAHEVKALADGRFQSSIQVAPAFYPMIIGKKGVSKKRIENETGTKIAIPRQGVENESVVISGPSQRAVLSACNRIDYIVESSRSRMSFTHFISLPLNHASVQSSFQDFKTRVLDMAHDDVNSVRKIDEAVFQTPSLLHLTVGTMALMGEPPSFGCMKVVNKINLFQMKTNVKRRSSCWKIAKAL